MRNKTHIYTSTAQTIPARAEVVMMLVIMALLIINLTATVRAANYQPECIPTIKTIEDR